jgi:hypothetical protein
MKPTGAPPAYKRPSPEMLKGQAKMYKKPLSALRKDAGLAKGERLYHKDIVSSVVEAHKQTRMRERICDGFGNVSQAHCY